MKIIDFTNSFEKIIFNNNYKFNSCNFCIIKYKNQFLIVQRFVNYEIESFRKPKQIISLNKLICLDQNLKIISEKIFEQKNDYYSKFLGIEDIRLFEYNNKIHYIGTYITKNNQMQISSCEFLHQNNTININPIYMEGNQKNWVYFDDLKIIYKWNPIIIGKIVNNKFIEIKRINTNERFKNIRGSTNGVKYKNKFIFIVHDNSYHHYIFILNKENIYLSNPFKFENKNIEFCIGLIFDNFKFYISYSTMDKYNKLLILDIDEFKQLKNCKPFHVISSQV